MEGLKDEAQESRCVSAILRHGVDAYMDVEGLLSANSFTFEEAQALWLAIVEFFETEEVKPTLASMIKYSNNLGYAIFEKKDNKDWLKSLFNLPTEVQDARILGAEIKKLEERRNFYLALETSMSNLLKVSNKDPLAKIVTEVNKPIDEFLAKLTSSNDEGDYLLKNADIHILNLLENPNTVEGLKSGFDRWDDYIGGCMEPETMHVIMARPKRGKSSIGLNAAINLAKRGTPSIICDMEMSEKKWVNRFLSNMTKIHIRKFQSATFTEEEKDKLSDAAKQISKFPILYVNVNGKSLDEANYCVKRLMNKKVGKNAAGKYDCLYIYDYLRVNDSQDVNSVMEYQALGFQAIKLKNFSIAMKIPTLTFVQESRAGDVSGSDRILWLCDSLCQFDKKTEDEMSEDRAYGRKEYNRKLVPKETRSGPEVEDGAYINYSFDGSIASIVEGPSNVELYKKTSTIQPTESDKNTKF